ncbi:MAG: hypothetical protein ACRDJM_11470 [Actinomycetota bacterium]
MKRMGSLVVVAAILATLGTSGIGRADCGPGGSEPNGSGSCETADNQVQCGPGTGAEGIVISASATGAEACNDGDVFPLDGRIGSQQDCSCAYIDGDADNDSDLLLDGWLRVDDTGVYCASRSTPGGQSYTATGQPIEECFG